MPHIYFTSQVVRASDMPLFTWPNVGFLHMAWSAALPAYGHLLSSKPYICGHHFPAVSVVSIRARSEASHGPFLRRCLQRASPYDVTACCLNQRSIDLFQHKVYVPIFQIIDTKKKNLNCLEVMILCVTSHYSAVCLPACNGSIKQWVFSKSFIPKSSKTNSCASPALPGGML